MSCLIKAPRNFKNHLKYLRKISTGFHHQRVLEHIENPHNVGSLDRKDKMVGTGLVGSPGCGNVMKFQIKVAKNGQIIETKFKTFGCGSAIACSSLATKWLKGKNIVEAGRLKDTDIAKELCLPKTKLHCSVLAEKAIKAALYDFEQKQNMEMKMI